MRFGFNCVVLSEIFVLGECEVCVVFGVSDFFFLFLEQVFAELLIVARKMR